MSTDSGAAFLKPEAVLSEMGSIPATYATRSVYDINTDSLERYLNTVNNFEHVEVVRTGLGKLRVSVIPLVPEARVFSSSGSYYINKDGKRMGAGAEFFVDLPVVRGDFTRQMPASGVLPVVQYIKKDKFLRDLVTMIDYKSPHDIMLIPRMRGHIINLGDTTDLPDKFEKLMLMYRKVMPHKGWNTYDTISLKFKGQIVATRADKRVHKHNNVTGTETEEYEEKALETDSESFETESVTPPGQDSPQTDPTPDKKNKQPSE